MTVSVPFSYIPADLLVPGFFFEVRALDNTGLLQFQSLLIGQVLPSGSLGPTVVAASANTASGSTLHFASVPSNIVVGMAVRDLTTVNAIPAGATVTAVTGTSVTISAAVAGGGVISADNIQFYPPTGPVLVSTVKQAKSLFGVGSMLANMVSAYRTIDSFGTLYALPLIDDPAAVKATGSINITGTVSATSVLYLYIAGVRIPVNLTASMQNDDIAIAIVGAVNAKTDLPVVASGSAFPVTFTANNAGASGNDIDIRLNYFGVRSDETTPVGLDVSITPMASGAVNPALDDALATLGSTPFDVIAAPYVDDTSLGSIETFLDDATGRWSYLQELFGHYFTAANKTVGALGKRRTMSA
jgi:phage tail sheath gpL-like